MSDKTPDGQPKSDGQPDKEKPLPKLIDQLKPPKIDRKQSMHWASASQFAYTLVFATLILGFIGHWIGAKLGGNPWDALLMLLFGGAGFCAEIYRMLIMFSPKKDDSKKTEESKKKDEPRNDSKKDS